MAPRQTTQQSVVFTSALAPPGGLPRSPMASCIHLEEVAKEFTQKAVDVASRLAPLLPHECYVGLAGGPHAYTPCPASERVPAAWHAICAAVGRHGDMGERLIRLLSKLKEYFRLRLIDIPMCECGLFSPLFFIIKNHICLSRRRRPNRARHAARNVEMSTTLVRMSAS